MARPQEYTDEQIIKAIQAKKGMVYLAARMLGCAHSTIFTRAKQSPAIQETIDSCRGRVIDDAELKLVAAINKGESWAIAFALKTIGKDRGYTERQEFSGVDGKPIEFSWHAVVTEIERGSTEDTNPSGTRSSLING